MFKFFIIVLLTFPLSAEKFDTMVDKLLQGSVPQITSTELSKELKTKKPPLLLDIREYKEYEISHLKNAFYMGYAKIDYSRLDPVNKATPIIVYCSIGKRSEDIGEILIKKGFTNVKNLRGGIFQWANEKRPIYKSKSEKTNTVHPYNRIWGRWLENHVVKQL